MHSEIFSYFIQPLLELLFPPKNLFKKKRKSKMPYKIFLDDERFPPENSQNFKIVRNYEEFCKLIQLSGLPDFISFDHDLGEEKTGHDCVKFLINYCLDNDLTPTFDFYVHSQNPIGKENIEALLNNFKNERQKENIS